MNLSNVVDLQLIIFTFMLTGIVLRKLNILPQSSRKSMTDLLIDLILPCNIITSFMIDMNATIIKKAFTVLLIALGVQIVCYLLGKVIFNKVDTSKKQVLQYATMCSNAGFMGNPIVEGIYGSLGLLYASVYLIPLRFFMWSAGISCFTRTNLKDTLKKLAFHPCIIAVWIGFFFMVTQLQLPSFLSKSLKYVSNCTLPISIIIIGTILAEVDYKTIISKLTLYFCFIRLVLIPITSLIICRLLNIDDLVTGVCVILAGMPAGSTTAILAEKYGKDSQYASKCIFLSTLLSLISIPMLYYVVEKF